MRIGHISDLHLGHRRYAAMAKDGRPQRSVDVAAALHAAVDQILAADVQLVLVAGDVYDAGNVRAGAITDALKAFTRLVKARIPVVMISGNHDEKALLVGSTGAENTGSPLNPLAVIGCKVVRRAERVTIPSIGAHILCVPEADVRRVKLEPSTARGTQLLLAHGRFQASLYKLPESECSSPSSISDAFDYAALGDFHVATEVAPRAWYSGSTEFTSSNPWSEIGRPKGWLLIDTDQRSVELQPVPTRPHIDLPRFSAQDMTPEDLRAKLLAQLEAQSIEGAVVRQVVVECHRGTRSAIDWKPIKAAAKAALHYQPDIRLPAEENRVRAMLETPDDDAPPEGFASWEAYDAWMRDDATEGADDFSIADAVRAGATPLLDPNSDPYNLNDTPRSAAAA